MHRKKAYTVVLIAFNVLNSHRCVSVQYVWENSFLYIKKRMHWDANQFWGLCCEKSVLKCRRNRENISNKHVNAKILQKHTIAHFLPLGNTVSICLCLFDLFQTHQKLEHFKASVWFIKLCYLTLSDFWLNKALKKVNNLMHTIVFHV